MQNWIGILKKFVCYKIFIKALNRWWITLIGTFWTKHTSVQSIIVVESFLLYRFLRKKIKISHLHTDNTQMKDNMVEKSYIFYLIHNYEWNFYINAKLFKIHD